MKDAEKMMSRCIFLNVLRATCNQSKLNGNRTDTLDRYVSMFYIADNADLKFCCLGINFLDDGLSIFLF